MSQFEYILIPFGMLAAFAVAETMASWARVIQSWGSIQNKFLYLSFSLWLVLNLLLGHFAGLWDYRVLAFTSLMTFFVLIPTLLFSMAMLVMSTSIRNAEDLDSHYFQYAPRTSVIALVAIVISTLTDLLPGLSFLVEILVPLSVQVIALLFLAFTRSKVVHIFANIALWATWLFFLVVNHVYA